MATNRKTVLLLVSVVLNVSSVPVLAHTDVTPEQAHDLIALTESLLVVDVREPSEYCDARGHIPGALDYPLTSGVLYARYEELPIDRPILVVCRSGARSNVAANFLDSQGFSEVYDMTGGMNAWLWETAPCKYSGGSGTADDPYQIATAADLIALGETPDDYDKHFILTADIDLDPNLPGGKVFERALIAPHDSDTEWSVLAPEFQGTVFSGTFDGNGHAVAHLTIEGGTGAYLGLFGSVASSGAIYGVTVENAVVTGRRYVGALIGYNEGSVSNCRVNCLLQGEGFAPWRFGGLIAFNAGSIDNCRVTGEIFTLDSSGYFGGLVGWNEGTLADSRVRVNITGGAGCWEVGGLVGDNRGPVTNCHAGGNVTGGDGCKFLGGLAGMNYDTTLTNCSATGHVSAGVRSNRVAGLVGGNPNGVIVFCYATGGVTADAECFSLGGLAGDNYGDIIDCWSHGQVSSGAGGSSVGGLIGYNGGSVATSYTARTVSVGAGTEHFGALIGGNSGNVDGCFWDEETSGPIGSAGGEGKTTAEMQTASTFLDAGWDFNDVWTIWEGYDYPRLRWAAGPSAGLVFVDIPGGTFAMGDHHGVGQEDERPVHVVRLDSFRMSKYETTNAQYAAFLNAAMRDGLIEIVDGTVYTLAAGDQSKPWCRLHSYHPEVQIQYGQGQFTLCHRDDGVDMSDHPVHRVSWYGAQAFCDHYGYRLPTEAEWEYAARGGYHDPYYMYPWGSNDIDPNLANYDQSNPLGLSEGPYHTPVGYYGAYGAYGLCDMSGNMLEWCGDTYGRNYYSNSPVDNPTGVAQDGLRAQRGGSLDSEPLACRVAERYRYGPTHTGSRFGFRVCTSTGSLEF